MVYIDRSRVKQSLKKVGFEDYNNKIIVKKCSLFYLFCLVWQSIGSHYSLLCLDTLFYLPGQNAESFYHSSSTMYNLFAIKQDCVMGDLIFLLGVSVC